MTATTSTIVSFFEQLKRYSHLQQLHSVLSKDLRNSRDKVLKESQAIRKELTFYRWCMRKNISEPYPFSTSGLQKSMDYDRLLFYRRLISYLHQHPHELGTIIVSLPEVRQKPFSNSLESLFFDRETDLAECVCFDIIGCDINSLVLLLRMILLGSKHMTRLSQKLFQLFIVITCHQLLNSIFRPLLKRLYKIEEQLAFNKLDGTFEQISTSSLFNSCNDVLSCIVEALRVLPIPLRQVISVMRHRLSDSPSQLWEYLLSTIFSPLLLNPDDWYLVICDPAKDEITNSNNIQSIVTTLMQLCRKFQRKEAIVNDNLPNGSDDESHSESISMIDILMTKHGSILSSLLSSILQENDPYITPSKVLVPSNATPELFIWHKIFLSVDSSLISDNLRSLVRSETPPKIPFRPYITVLLPTLASSDNINIGSDDFTKQPLSKFIDENILKPIRVFLVSLTEAQSRVVHVRLFTDGQCSPLIQLNIQQTILLSEARSRLISNNITHEHLNELLIKVVDEYRNEYCNNLQEALSTANVLTSLNYIQLKESTLKQLHILAIHTHENLQIRDILLLTKKQIPILREQLNKIAEDQLQAMTQTSDGSNWNNDKFVIFRTQKWISKTRNATIRFLNDYGIGKVDFKCKFGGSVLDFTEKRISRLLVNAVIFLIQDIFWRRCPIEDGKFLHEIVQLTNKYPTFVEFYSAFLKADTKIPQLSEYSLVLMVDKMKGVNGSSTVGEFEKCISDCRDMLVASIHGANAATGDDYMPLLCYILLQAKPEHLPSQLQTCRVISQRKIQDKYFIDCCVAMKALRNFCTVIFEKEAEQYTKGSIGVITGTNSVEQQNGHKNTSNISPPSQPPPSSPNILNISTSGLIAKRNNLVNRLRSKLPQMPNKADTTSADLNGNKKKNFFNISSSAFQRSNESGGSSYKISGWKNKSKSKLKSVVSNEVVVKKVDIYSSVADDGIVEEVESVPLSVVSDAEVVESADENVNDENGNENEENDITPVNDENENNIMVEVQTQLN